MTLPYAAPVSFLFTCLTRPLLRPSFWWAMLALSFASAICSAGAVESEKGAASYAQTIRHLAPLAEQGDPNAQFRLGILVARGYGSSFTPSPEIAHDLFAKAAVQGHLGAQFQLGFQFERGVGTQSDLKKAIFFYMIAAKKRHVNAQFNLAVLHANGRHMKADYIKAYRWVSIAHQTALTQQIPGQLSAEIKRVRDLIRDKLTHGQAARVEMQAIAVTGMQV